MTKEKWLKELDTRAPDLTGHIHKLTSVKLLPSTYDLAAINRAYDQICDALKVIWFEVNFAKEEEKTDV